jgi:hypothetical protein
MSTLSSPTEYRASEEDDGETPAAERKTPIFMFRPVGATRGSIERLVSIDLASGVLVDSQVTVEPNT